MIATIIFSCLATTSLGLQPQLFSSEARSALQHLQESFPAWNRDSQSHYYPSVQELANIEIPRSDGGTVLAYQTQNKNNHDRILILLHEFFGLSQSICDKADALARDLDCTVVAPDTFRGVSSTFIPKCIWLALSTPQERVNSDLDDILNYYFTEQDSLVDFRSLAVMGFCYGGGKAIRYTTQCQPDAATVICYGSPLTDVGQLSKLNKPVCGIFGRDDLQFSMSLLEKFESAMEEADVEKEITIYDGVGHAFWSDMEQIERKEQPQYDAYQQVMGFLKTNL